MLTTKKWGVAAAGVAMTSLFLLASTGCAPAGSKALLTGERLLREGRAAEAIEPLTQAALSLGTNAPAIAQALNHLGLAYHYTGQFAKADRAYQLALARDFNLVVARYNRGSLLLEQNQLTGAINELTAYTALRPQHCEAWLELATAQLRARQLDAAERSAQQALNLNLRPEQRAEAWNLLGMSQAFRKRSREALLCFQSALKHQTNHAPTVLNQAIVAQQLLNDRAFALQRYRAYLDFVPAAENQAAIRARVAQLDQELNPPPSAQPTNAPMMVITPTNSAARLTNLAANLSPASPPTAALAAGRTNAAAATPKPETRADAPVVTASPPSAVPPAPRPESRPPEPRPATPEPERKPSVSAPVEVVTLDTEPEVRPAQALAPPPSIPAAAPLAARPSSSPTAAETLRAPEGGRRPGSATADRAAAVEQASPRTSLVQKLNPLKWFGSKKKTAPEPKIPLVRATTPIPAPSAPQPLPVRTNPAPAPAMVAAATVAPAAPAKPPGFATYLYKPSVKPVAGNRVEASRLFTEGVRAQRNGRAAEAVAAYKQAVLADPAYFDAQYNLGVTAFETGDWLQALAALEQALAISPADTNARFNFALTLQKANYPLDAAAELETVLNRNPDDAEAHLALAGLCAQTLGQPKRAREHYLRLLSLQPSHPQASAIRYWLARNP